jgi:hypothetical protein
MRTKWKNAGFARFRATIFDMRGKLRSLALPSREIPV